MAGYVRVLGTDIARDIRDIFEDWTEATKGVAELNDAERDAMFAEYEQAWAELPGPVRGAAIAGVCKVWGAVTRTGAAGERRCNKWLASAEAVREARANIPEDDDDSGNGHPGGTDVEPPSSQEDVDNTRDPHAPDLPHARRMCAAYPDNDFFCGQVADSEQDDGQ